MLILTGGVRNSFKIDQMRDEKQTITCYGHCAKYYLRFCRLHRFNRPLQLIYLSLEASSSLTYTIHIVFIGNNRAGPILIVGALLRCNVLFGSKSLKRLQAKTSTCIEAGKVWVGCGSYVVLKFQYCISHVYKNIFFSDKRRDHCLVS